MSMHLRDMKLTGTTDGSGDLTVNGEAAIFGLLYAIEWVKGTFDNGVDATFTVQSTPSGVAYTILTLTDANANAIYYPRKGVHSDVGAALTYDGTRAINDLPLLIGKPRMVVAQGGNAKTGSAILYYLANQR